MKTITRADLADKVYEELGFSYSESSELVDSVFEEVIHALKNGEDVKLSSFGTFHLRDKKARVGRNPKTKKEATIAARRVATFGPSNLLMKKINPSG